MKQNFLYGLQNDILKKEGIYKIYGFIFIFSFLITIEDIKPLIQVFRIVIVIVPLVILILIYLKYKRSRNGKEDSIIKKNILLFTILTAVAIYSFIKDLI